MRELDELIQDAFITEGAQDKINKVYITLFRTLLYMPAYRQNNEEEPFRPLFMEDEGKYFIPVFDTMLRLQTWAANEYKNLDYVEILGEDVIRGVANESVYLCLNAGTNFYKEFSPDEISRLKKMLAKIDSLKDGPNKA